MKGKLLAVVGALVAAQVFSGCYILRELNWDTDKVKPGNKTTAELSLDTSGSTLLALRGSSDPGYFFLTTLAESSEGVTVKRPTFDTENVTGQKDKMVSDQDLGDLAFEGSCGALFPIRRGPSGPPHTTFRTSTEVDDDTNKMVPAKLPVKVADDAPGGGFFGVVLSGVWIDDGDGMPEDPGSTDDEIECTGLMSTTFDVKGELAP